MNDIAKLPKWAQDHIAKLRRERDLAVRALNESLDHQKESPIFYTDHVYTGEDVGPSEKVFYIQSDHVTFRQFGIELDVSTLAHSQRSYGGTHAITLRFEALNSRDGGMVAVIPVAENVINLLCVKPGVVK